MLKLYGIGSSVHVAFTCIVESASAHQASCSSKLGEVELSDSRKRQVHLGSTSCTQFQKALLSRIGRNFLTGAVEEC